MDTAITQIGFGPEALWITFGTLTALAALVLLGIEEYLVFGKKAGDCK